MSRNGIKLADQGIIIAHWTFEDGVASKETFAVIEFSLRGIYCANSIRKAECTVLYCMLACDLSSGFFSCPVNNTAVRHQPQACVTA